MINHTPLCTLLFPAFAAMASGAPPSTQEDAAHTAPGRYASLLKALDSNDWSVRMRAIMELGETVDNPTSREKLLGLAFSTKMDATSYEDYELLRALWRSDTGVVPAIIKGYTDHEEGANVDFDGVLLMFAHMGPKAAQAIPFLMGQSDKHKAQPMIQGAIQVVLANIGHQPDRIARALLTDIRNRSERGKGAVAMMALAPSGNWVDHEIIAELVNWLGKPETYESDHAACALSLLGEKAKSAAGKLQSLAEKDTEVAPLYQFALASVDGSQRDRMVRIALKQIATDLEPHMLSWSVLCLTSDMIAQIVRSLEDRDPRVVCGAIVVLCRLGLSAKAGAPVLAVLMNSSDENVREEAAKALATVGHPSQIPTLEAIATKEPSESVREAIEESLRILRLQEKPVRE